MRRFITAFVVLSILVMAQNVVASAPLPASSSTSLSVALPGAEIDTASLSPAPVRGAPSPRTLLLFILGLSGLAAVGHRTEPEPVPACK